MNAKAPGHPRLFLVAAVYNWAASLVLALFHDPILAAIHAPPLVYPAALELFAALAFLFGVGYFWAFQDPEKNRPIIVLGTWGKITVFIISAAHFLAGDLPGPLLAGAVGDLVFAGFFVAYLKKTSHSV
ncbi:MAG: hypothetical protein KKA60_09740 [Proteobacteria bacterium]|nr:hypothetical protein [Pseudomonadota bacterium]